MAATAKRARTACSIAQAAGLRVSARAIGRVLDALASLSDYDPDECSVETLRRTLKSWHSDLRSPVGPLFISLDVPMADGSVYQWHVVSPFALLWHLAGASASFSEFLRDTIGDKISNLTLWGDECTTGNALRPDNRNKFVLVYISWHEFPSWWRWLDEGWIPIGLMRYTVMERVKSKYSGLLKCLLRYMLRGSINFIDGFLVKLNSGAFIRIQSR
jgi:hypothetical protein